MTKLAIGEPLDVNAYRDLIESIPDSEFASATRSTIPLLDYWRPHEERLQDLLPQLRLPFDPNDGELRFEYPVRSPSGRGKASFTDLMYVARESALALEGKWTEPDYESVSSWRRRGGESANKAAVLAGWLSLIAPHSEGIDMTDVEGCVYQMVHRTASVCSLKKSNLRVCYQVFHVPGETHRASYEDRLRQLVQAIRPKAHLQVWLMNVEMRKTDAWTALEAALVHERPELARELLTKQRLFEFERASPVRILP